MRTFTAIALLLAGLSVRAFDFTGPQMDSLLDAIAAVESNNTANAVGDGGKAVGAYQLHAAYVRECNRVAKTAYTAADRADAAKSREITRQVLTYWGKRLERDLGRAATPAEIAKIHNGFRWWKRLGDAAYQARLAKYAARIGAALAEAEAISKN